MRVSSKIGLLTAVLLGIVVFLFGSESTYAITTICDGGATEENGFRASPNQGGKTHARDVDPSVSRAWERNQIQRRTKSPHQRYNAKNGNNLIYNTYKKDWRVSKIGGEDFFIFDGWSVNKGYHHHHERNQATYVGVVNTKNNKRKIFKTMMMSGTADQDIHYNFHGSYRRCANDEYQVEAGVTGGCNMDYQMTRFRAYIPLNELFGDREDSEWRFYIIKNVDRHLVFDSLILPYSHDGFNWNDGQLTLDSGRNVNRLLITQDNSVIKREKARGTSDLGRFRTTHNPFTKVAENETTGVANWYGIRDKASGSIMEELYGLHQFIGNLVVILQFYNIKEQSLMLQSNTLTQVQITKQYLKHK